MALFIQLSGPRPVSSTLGNQITGGVHGNIVHTKTHTESNHTG